MIKPLVCVHHDWLYSNRRKVEFEQGGYMDLFWDRRCIICERIETLERVWKNRGLHQTWVQI